VLKLDQSVRIVTLQFSFSNPAVLPSFLDMGIEEWPNELVERKIQNHGDMVIAETHNCDISRFLAELERTGYCLVSGFCQERINHNKKSQGTYWMVRFMFVRKDCVRVSEGFEKVKHLVRAGLLELVSEALWRVRAFRNPFFKDGEEVTGECALSINLEVRKPLLAVDSQKLVTEVIQGKEVTVPSCRRAVEWLTGPDGKRIGEGPVPVQPKHQLRVQDSMVQLVPNS